ncbi:hypothetical protein ABPG75_000335 [Micractinium tetrahymenae]
MAEKLTIGGAPGWQGGRQEAALAAFDSATLARLVRSMSQQAVRGLHRAPPVFDVRPGGPGQAGGFTWAVPGFSRRAGSGGCLLSFWTEVAGFQWCNRLHPGGSGSGGGSHLSAFVQLDHTRALSAGHRSVAATFSLTLFDQGEGGRDFVAVFECQAGCSASGAAIGGASRSLSVGHNSSSQGGGLNSGGTPAKGSSGDGASTPGTPCRSSDGKAPSGVRTRQHGGDRPCQGVFSKEADTWGRHQFLELSELRRKDRAYLKKDRLLLRLDLRVHSAVPA